MSQKEIIIKKDAIIKKYDENNLSKKIFKLKKNVKINYPVRDIDLQKLKLEQLLFQEVSRLKNKAFLKIGNLTN